MHGLLQVFEAAIVRYRVVGQISHCQQLLRGGVLAAEFLTLEPTQLIQRDRITTAAPPNDPIQSNRLVRIDPDQSKMFGVRAQDLHFGRMADRIDHVVAIRHQIRGQPAGEAALPLPRIDLPIAYAWCEAPVPQDIYGPWPDKPLYLEYTKSWVMGLGASMPLTAQQAGRSGDLQRVAR